MTILTAARPGAAEGLLDLNASQMVTSPNASFIFDYPPYGGMTIGATSVSLSFRVAQGIAPMDARAPRVAIYREMVPRFLNDGSPRLPEFKGLEYAFWAEHRGGAFGVDRYFFNAQGLEQDTRYFLVITSDAKNPSLPISTGGPITVSAWAFRTAHRDVTVEPTALTIHLDGDPGGSGEMYFEYAVYDGETGDPYRIARYPAQGLANISDSTIIPNPFGGNFYKRCASNSMRMMIYGEDDDTPPFPLPGQGFEVHGEGVVRGAYSSPEYAGWRWNFGAETPTDVYAMAGAAWAFLEMPGLYEQPFSLFSGNYGISFTLTGRIRVEVIPHPQDPTPIGREHPSFIAEPVRGLSNLRPLKMARKAKKAANESKKREP